MSPSQLLRFAVAACFLACAAASSAHAQDPASKSNRGPTHGTDAAAVGGSAIVERLGSLLVGDEAPDVDLTDTDGRPFHLGDARRSGPWLLVFARAPQDLEGARAARSDLAALGIGVVGIGPFHRELADPAALRFLPDHASHFARVYGVFDPVTSNPRTGAFLVGRDGHVRLIVSGAVPASEDLVKMANEALNPPPTAADTR